MKWLCPVCRKPYTWTSEATFPRHGRRWVPEHGDTPGAWEWCSGSSVRINASIQRVTSKGTGART